MPLNASLVPTLALATFAVAGCSPSEPGPRLADSNAREIMEEYCSEGIWRIQLGDVEVLRPGFRQAEERQTLSQPQAGNSKKPRLSANAYQDLKTWQVAGLIEITTKEILGERSSRQDGVQMVVHVSATERGREFDAESSSKDSLVIRSAPCRVDAIVTNQLITTDADIFRIVKGTYTSQLSDELTRYYEAIGHPRTSERKFQLLLKFDPFDKDWNIVAYDGANISSEFPSDKVGKYLSGLSR